MAVTNLRFAYERQVKISCRGLRSLHEASREKRLTRQVQEG